MKFSLLTEFLWSKKCRFMGGLCAICFGIFNLGNFKHKIQIFCFLKEIVFSAKIQTSDLESFHEKSIFQLWSQCVIKTCLDTLYLLSYLCLYNWSLSSELKFEGLLTKDGSKCGVWRPGRASASNQKERREGLIAQKNEHLLLSTSSRVSRQHAT